MQKQDKKSEKIEKVSIVDAKSGKIINGIKTAAGVFVVETFDKNWLTVKVVTHDPYS